MTVSTWISSRLIYLFYVPGLKWPSKGENNGGDLFSTFSQSSGNRRCCKICFTSYLDFWQSILSSFRFIDAAKESMGDFHLISKSVPLFGLKTNLSVGPMADFLGDAREPQRVRGPISKCHFLSPTANVTLSDDTNPHYQYLALDNTIKQCHVSDANY